MLTPGARKIFYFLSQNPVPFVQNSAVYLKKAAGFAQNPPPFGLILSKIQRLLLQLEGILDTVDL